jgi:phosphatidylglycerol lysyltransferase
MRQEAVSRWILTLATLGSGLITLFSLMKPPLPARAALLHSVFPLEFLQLSRFSTLLTGFALVISSVNIYRRKRRAYQIVLVLSMLSILFHLTKGLDYEEALFSLLLLCLLLCTRRSFTVSSSLPDLRSELIRLGIAAIVAFGYGVGGFWLLDRREFGVNFTLADSIHRTLLFLALIGDPHIAPHTRHARWFLESLYLITITASGYSVFALFRPALYRFTTLPRERATATAILRQHGRSALDYFKNWPDKSFFFSDSEKSFIAYSVGSNFAVVLGDPVGPEEEMELVIRRFSTFCRENDWRLAFHATLPDFLPIYRRLGFKKLKVGDDAVVDLAQFDLAGKSMKKIRHTIRSIENERVRTIRHEPPIPDSILAEVKAVSDEWLKIPGRRERRFSLGMFDPGYLRSTPLFTAEREDGRVLAFVNIIPSYRKGEATVDLMRRRTDAPNGIMDFLFIKLFLHFKQSGFERFNLGMAPMAGFQAREEASVEERAVHFFFQRMNFLFSYRGLHEYKAKFATHWEPRYEIYRRALDLPRLAIALGKIAEVGR